ncbi:MAG: GAF domain-containing protein, partial [Candidatus Angelobacter sp.]
FVAEASTLLVLLAGAILLFRSFREKYLVPWIAGWSVYTFSRLFIALSHTDTSSRLWIALACASYALAVFLFGSAVFTYVFQKELLWPLGLTLALGLCCGLSQILLAPQISLLGTIFYLSWHIAGLVAAAALARFAWGRPNAGRWLLTAMLLFLHFDSGQNAHELVGEDILFELLLGISMIMIVLDDSRVQIARLDILNRLTNQISDSQDFDSTVAAVLGDLVKITRAGAAWFRTMEGDKLVLAVQHGLSAHFAEQTRVIDSTRSVSGLAIRDSEVYILRAGEATAEARAHIRAEGFHHLVLVPVEGKNARIGVLALGMRHLRSHTENEKNFLKAAAKQVGLAAENHRLLKQVAYSRNEWASTFNSIPDLILVHDKEFRIMRANQALAQRLAIPRDQVVGQFCASVLPG